MTATIEATPSGQFLRPPLREAEACEVVVHFKRTPQAIFARAPRTYTAPNQIALRVQPDERSAIGFAAKGPGDDLRPIGVEADFSCAKSFRLKVPSAYATLQLAVMHGDPTRFTRHDEADAEWRNITAIEEGWATLPATAFPNYAAGSDGPSEASVLVARGGHQWHPMPSPRPAKKERLES